MPSAIDLLFTFADALFVPVVVGLFAMLAFAIYSLGAFLREAFARRAPGRNALRRNGLPTDANARKTALDALELAFARRIDRDAMLARLGPMFGLAGTLIPLGPGLRSLQEGNLSGLGNQLAIAFATTVTGLAVAAICYTLSGVRALWYEADLRALTDAPVLEAHHG